MKPPPQPVAEIAKQAAEEICEKMDGFSIHCSGVPEMESELTALILSAAAKMVQQSGAVEALELANRRATAHRLDDYYATGGQIDNDYEAQLKTAAAIEKLRSITGEAGDRQG